jgi:hypothetical protein
MNEPACKFQNKVVQQNNAVRDHNVSNTYTSADACHPEPSHKG